MVKSLDMKKIWAGIIILSLFSLFNVACTDDKDSLPVGNGYVQFKVYKSASYEKNVASRANANVLDSLYEATKVKVVLRSNDFEFSQTMALHAYDEQNAEFGLRSDKLELQAGDYTVVGFYLYDRAEKAPIYIGLPTEKTVFSVTSGGLVVQDLLVDAVNRGMVKFQLVKNILSRGVDDAEKAYPFSSINKVDIRVKNLDTKIEQEFKSLEVEYVEDFNGSGTGYRTSVGKIDSLVVMEAGTYQVLSYTAYNRNEILQYFNDEVLKEAIFTVADNVQTEADVPVTLSESAPNIKDYVALKAIWEKMEGENWSYQGQSYPKGMNWSFDDKDIDMWGNQPGVILDANGRVTSLSLGEFGAKGVVPAEIGQLSELQTLTLGTHNDLLGYDNKDPLTGMKGQLTAEVLKKIRTDYMDNVVVHDIRADLSEPLKLGMEIKGHYKRSAERKGVSTKDVVWGDLTNGITGIHPAIGKLKKLNVLYIANAPIAALPEATVGNETEEPGFAGLTALTDLEIYNCPKMVTFPEVIAGLPELVQLNMAMNKQLTSAEFNKGLQKLARGSAQKKIQILYLGYNNISELPAEVSDMEKLGKIDLIQNKLKVLPGFGSKVNLVQGAFDYNEITSIGTKDGIFCGMDDVETLSFSHNKLETLPSIFNVKSPYIMGSVDFSYNEIKDAGLVGFSGINTSNLSLAGNKLTKFPKQLFSTGSPLTILNLSANRIAEFDKGDLTGDKTYLLTTLDLTYNRLSKLPDDFDGKTLPYLYGLDISGNRLTGFPWGAANISYLTVLSLRNQRDDAGNRVYEEWPESIAQHIGLRALFLGGNNIGKVPDTETISYRIYTLDVSDNPNLILDVSDVCAYIKANMYTLIYDPDQDIRGCDALDLE